jgi:hypothetical protein
MLNDLAMKKSFIFYNRYFWSSQCLCIHFHKILDIRDVVIRTRSRKNIDTGAISLILFSLIPYIIATANKKLKRFRSRLKKLILLGCFLTLHKNLIFLIFEKLYNFFLPYQIQSEWTILNAFNIKANKFYFRVNNCKTYEGVNDIIFHKISKNMVVSSFTLFIMVNLTNNYLQYISALVVCQWFTWREFQYNYIF